MPGAPSSHFPPESPHWVSLAREALVRPVAEPAQGRRQNPVAGTNSVLGRSEWGAGVPAGPSSGGLGARSLLKRTARPS